MAGGRISQDITTGYGPEEYIIKKAHVGNYNIRAKFFSNRVQSVTRPVSVQITLFTRFGMKNQKEKSFSIELKDGGDELKLGSFEWKDD